jgi:hypothetical protein
MLAAMQRRLENAGNQKRKKAKSSEELNQPWLSGLRSNIRPLKCLLSLLSLQNMYAFGWLIMGEKLCMYACVCMYKYEYCTMQQSKK